MTVLFVIITVLEIAMAWECIRSIIKKPLNLPPSSSKWAKVQIKVKSEKLSEYYSTEDDGAVMRGGIPIVNHISTLKVEAVNRISYEYEGKTYDATITSKGRLGRSAQVYCLKSDPTRVRLYVEKQPKPMGVVVGYGLFFVMLLACELVFISEAVSR